jgi:replicative DNA helicase
MNVITKSLPYAEQAEKGLISCFLEKPDLLTDAQNTLPREAFYQPDCRLIYETMLEMYGDELPITYITLSELLENRELIHKVGGQGRLAELLDFAPTPTHYTYYRGLATDKLLTRRLMAACDDSKEDASAMLETPQVALDAASDRFYALQKQQTHKGHRSFKDIISTYRETWEARAKGEKAAGIPTRWRSFNQTFGGLTPALWLIAGYPSDGKSSLAQNLVEDVLAQGKHALWISEEMSETDLVDRLITAKTRLNSQKIFFPQNGFDRQDASRITTAADHMEAWPLHLRCETGWTFEQMMSETRALSLKHDLGVVVIDYLQLLTTTKDYDTRAQQIAAITRAMKRTSGSLSVPIVFLSQLSDDGKTYEGRSPTQDAVNALCIEQEQEGWDKATRKNVKRPAGLRVAKNRNGKKGHLLPIYLDGATFTFRERDVPQDDGELPVQTVNGRDWE